MSIARSPEERARDAGPMADAIRAEIDAAQRRAEHASIASCRTPGDASLADASVAAGFAVDALRVALVLYVVSGRPPLDELGEAVARSAGACRAAYALAADSLARRLGPGPEAVLVVGHAAAEPYLRWPGGRAPVDWTADPFAATPFASEAHARDQLERAHPGWLAEMEHEGLPLAFQRRADVLGLRPAIAQFVSELRFVRRVSPHTSDAYARDLAQFARFVDERMPGAGPRDLTALLLRSWLGAGGLAPASISRKLGALRSFLGFLHRRGAVDTNVAEEIAFPKVQRVPPNVLRVTAAASVLAAPSDDSPLGLRDRALLETLYAGALRVSELCALNVESLVVDGGLAHVRVIGKGNVEREVPFGAAAVEAVRRYLERRAELAHPTTGRRDAHALFLSRNGTRLGVRSVQKLVQRYGAISGRPDLHPHLLRHTSATHLLNGGADVRLIGRILGHQGLGSTQRYTHPTEAHLAKVYDLAHPLARRARRMKKGTA